MAVAVAPLAAQAETINLYGWQNHSWEFVDIDGGRSFDRIQSNAGNIGFAASVDTGMNGIKVNLQCEQFTYYNHFAGGTGWCNRNSKIGLAHPQMGEIMFATWLLPYNEGVAQWVDPFYDAGADSHTSIMGSVGANTIFYNTGDFDQQASASHHTNRFDGSAEAYDNSAFEGFPEFNYSGLGYDTGFNRRQENIIQYWSPNWNGFVFRFAWTVGTRDETAAPVGGGEIDPVIRSSSLAYTNGPMWLAVTWQDHEDWTAASVGEMASSDAESWRLAGRYIADLGDGMSVQISAMYEDLEYEFNGVSNFDAAMSAFGYGGAMESYMLSDMGSAIMKTDTKNLRDVLKGFDDDSNDVLSGEEIICGIQGGDDCTGPSNNDAFSVIGDELREFVNSKIMEYNQGTLVSGGSDTTPAIGDGEDTTPMIRRLAQTLNDDGSFNIDLRDLGEDGNMDADGNRIVEGAHITDFTNAFSSAADMKYMSDRSIATEGANVKIEREAWMVSGKIKFGGPVDFRFSYMDADDLEVSCGACTGDWQDTAADAWNIGLFYIMPAGTELRLTYSEVDNDDNGTYGQGISGTGLGSPGGEVEMFALGIVHWFD